MSETPLIQQSNQHYYQQFRKIMLANQTLIAHMKQLKNEKQSLADRLAKMQKYADDLISNSKDEQKKKRYRRTAPEISRPYKCKVLTCQKSYGSEGSLHQHIKLKHPELYQQLNSCQAHDDEEQEQKD